MDITSVQRASALTAPTAAAPASPNDDRRELIQAIKAVNRSEFLGMDRELSFARDQETGRPVVRIVDRSTREIVQQVPPEYVLRLARELRGSSSKTGDTRR